MATNTEMLKFYLHRGFENCLELINEWDPNFFVHNCGLQGNCILNADKSVTIFDYNVTPSGLDILKFDLRDLCTKLNVTIERNKEAKGINIFKVS